MKKICLTLLGLATITTSLGQGAFSNQTNIALERVINDSRYNYSNIRGELMTRNSASANFASKVDIPGSLQCSITQYQGSNSEDTYSWSSIVLQTSNFHHAKSQFLQLYDQIKNTIIKIDGEKPFILNGRFEEPLTDCSQAPVMFKLLPSSGRFQQLIVELKMQSSESGWKILLSVYEE